MAIDSILFIFHCAILVRSYILQRVTILVLKIGKVTCEILNGPMHKQLDNKSTRFPLFSLENHVNSQETETIHSVNNNILTLTFMFERGMFWSNPGQIKQRMSTASPPFNGHICICKSLIQEVWSTLDNDPADFKSPQD